MSLPFTTVMKRAAEAIRLDGDNNLQAAYGKYLECICVVTHSLMQTFNNAGKRLIIDKDIQKYIQVGQQCMDRLGSIVENIGNMPQTPESLPVKKQPVPPNTSSTVSMPPVVVAAMPPPADTPSAKHYVRSKGMSPMELAQIRNQQLLTAYKSRMAKMNKRDKVSSNLGLTIQRKMAENLAIARAREEIIAKKMKERQQRLEEQAARRFASPIGVSEDDHEQRHCYRKILEYEQDMTQITDWRNKLDEDPNDPVVIHQFIEAILSCSDHPLSVLMKKYQGKLYHRLYPLISKRLDILHDAVVPLDADLWPKPDIEDKISEQITDTTKNDVICSHDNQRTQGFESNSIDQENCDSEEPIKPQDSTCEEPMKSTDSVCEEPIKPQDSTCEEPMKSTDSVCEEPIETKDCVCEECIGETVDVDLEVNDNNEQMYTDNDNEKSETISKIDDSEKESSIDDIVSESNIKVNVSESIVENNDPVCNVEKSESESKIKDNDSDPGMNKDKAQISSIMADDSENGGHISADKIENDDNNSEISETQPEDLETVSENVKDNLKEALSTGEITISMLERENEDAKKLLGVVPKLSKNYQNYDMEDMDDLFDESDAEDDLIVVNRQSTENNENVQKSNCSKNLEPTTDSSVTSGESSRLIENQKQEALKRHLQAISEDVHTYFDKLQVMFILTYEQLDSPEGRDQCYVSLEEPFFKPFWDLLLTLFRITNHSKEIQASYIMTKYGEMTPSALQIDEKLCLETLEAQCCPYQAAIKELRDIQGLYTPLTKLDCLVRVSRLIVQCVDDHYLANISDGTIQRSPSIGADDLIPLLNYVLVQSRLPQMVSECQAMEEFIPEGYMMAEEGYCLTSMQAALGYMLSLK